MQSGINSILEKYIRQFAALRRAQGRMWGPDTRKKAPHKPLLLLAIIDLVERGSLLSPVVVLENHLVELNELFTNYWRQVVPLSQQTSIAFPFSRLFTEPFWKLIPLPGKEINRANVDQITAVSQLRKLASSSRMDEDLFALMTDLKARNILRSILIDSHFSLAAGKALWTQVMVHTQSWEYAEQLEMAAKEPLVDKVIKEREVTEPVRDQGFRKAVVGTYDHRCALCGMRVITSEGHTCVDAAHIIPWSESHNDDIRNGMALCKLCHWAFDHRMAAVKRDYTVLISRQVQQTPNVADSLLRLQGKPLHKPANQPFWPALVFLDKHRLTRFAG